jgi:poly [ADP-ribose] polymerase
MASTLPLDGCTVALSGTFGVTHSAINDTITSLGGDPGKSVTANTTCLISTQADLDKSSTKIKAALKHDVPIVSLDWLDQCESSQDHKDPQQYVLTAGTVPMPSASASASTSLQGVGKKPISPDSSPVLAPVPVPAPALRKGRSKKPVASPSASPVLAPVSVPTLALRKGRSKKPVASPSASPVLAPTVMAPVTQKGKGKKRAVSPGLSLPPAVAPDAKKAKTVAPKFGEGSVVKSKDIVIPLDDNCFLTSYRVYVDDDGVVYDATLNQTNASHNNNKFYRVQVRTLLLPNSMIMLTNIFSFYKTRRSFGLGRDGDVLAIGGKMQCWGVARSLTL